MITLDESEVLSENEKHSYDYKLSFAIAYKAAALLS